MDQTVQITSTIEFSSWNNLKKTVFLIAPFFEIYIITLNTIYKRLCHYLKRLN